MPTRILGKPKTTPRRPLPQRREDWNKLLKAALQRAEANQDRRSEGIKRAMIDNKAEAHLRRLGIVCDADLTREFPKKKD